MKYVPFETIEEIECFYCHSIWKDEKEYFVIGSKLINNKLNIIINDTDKKEYVVPADEALNEFKFINRPFGKMEEENDR